ncbi:M16 family metallopeptidase [Fretibacter rubidus]|uniref:M16 family metallopeptidase n=1 Tax=Fretibacter rubidus TaxID=570162 RepID=UPI00352A6F55
MLKSILCASVAALALVACSVDSPKQGRDTAPSAQAQSSFTLPYEKFTLDNGLEVVLHVDRSDPIVAVTTVIHAGSNRERPGRTGFAHFFEHMAFNDSENVPRGWNRKAIPEWGGTRNGGTWSDGTIYYEVVPKDAFDKILWIDSDRLGYMINTVTQAALDREKQVVKNEKRQRVDNAPYGYTGEVIRTALYPEGHPYSWTVIGSLPDLQAATLDDLKEFHSEFYGPNNATLSIVGDIDIAETKRKVEQWFGEIPRGQDIDPLAPMPVTLDADKALYFEDNFATLPELRLTFPTVEGYHPDAIALRVLGQIIAGSKNSVLFKNVVEADKLAPTVSAYNNAMEIAGEFVVRVRGNAGTDLDDVYASINKALAEFEANGVSAQDLKRIKAEQETQLYAGISTVLGKGRELASSNEFAGDPAYVEVEAKAIQALTADDITSVYTRYIKDKPAVITSFVPKGQSGLSLTGSSLASVWIEEVKDGAESEKVSAGDLADFEKTPTKFDRSEPPFGELPLIKMPDIWDTTLPSGARILGIENSEIPLVSFDITIPGGALTESADNSGRLSLLARLMNEGTQDKSAAEIEQAIGLLGSSISVSSGRETTRISATTLARNFEPTVDIINDIISKPRFETADFDRVKSAAMTRLKGQEANPNAVASQVFSQLIYSPEHPMGRGVAGTVDSVSALTLDDMRAAHTAVLSAKPQFHITGDIAQSRAVAAFKSVAKHFSMDAQPLSIDAVPAQENTGKVFFVDIPDSKQSVLMIGRLTVPTTHPDAVRLDITNEKLGGGISGDLAQVLRIEKGYTYGAYSWVSSGTQPQPFQIRSSVRANATEASLDVIRDMLRDYGPSFTDADKQMVQQKLVKEKTRAFESLGAKLGTLRDISAYDKAMNYVELEQKALLNMPTSDFKALAATYLDESQMTYLIIGDKATQLGPVQNFARQSGKGDVTQLDIFGTIVAD